MARNLVTVAQYVQGDLGVASWDVDIDGNVNLNPGIGIERGSGPASSISVATNLSTYRLATAVRDGGGNLKVIAWDINDSGRVTRLGDDGAGAVSLVSATALSDFTIATAVRDGGGNLKVIAWNVDGDGNVTRRGYDGAGAVSLVSAATVWHSSAEFPDTDVVTTVRDGGGNLKVIAWNVDGDGNVTRRGDFVGGAVDLLDSARLVLA